MENTPDFADTVPAYRHSQNEEFDPLKTVKINVPDLYRRIIATWGSKELSESFTRWLLVDNHRFSGNVATALLMISEKHGQLFDHESTPNFNAWAELR